MKHWRQRLLTLVLVFSIWLCATTFRINIVKRQLVEYKWIRIYTTLVNLLYILSLPNAVIMNIQHNQLYASNVVAVYASYVIIATRVATILVVIFTRAKMDAQLKEWLRELLRIQTTYFDRFADIPRNTTHRKWLYFNCALTFIHTLSVLFKMWFSNYRGNVAVSLDLYLLYGVVGLQHVYMLHHAGLLCWLRECFSIVNNQLRLNCLDPKLGMIFSKLCCLSYRLNLIYSRIIMWVQLSLIITNSMVGYVVVLALVKPHTKVGSYGYIFGNSFYLMLLVHMYIYFIVCDWVVQTTRETDVVLMPYIMQPVEEEIEKIALNRCANKMSVDSYGIFHLNANTLFSIFAQTLLYTIILVQGNYKIST